MPDDSNGVHSLPSGYLAVTGQTIEASQHNPPLEDISQALTARMTRNGSAPMLANLNMGGNKVINLATPTAGSDAVPLSYYRFANNLTEGTIPDGRFPAVLPAVSGANLTNLPSPNIDASNIVSGTIPNARFPATLPAISGVNITNINASNIASGTLGDARLPTSMATKTLTGITSFGTSMTINPTDGSFDDITTTKIFRITGALGLRVQAVYDNTIATPPNVLVGTNGNMVRSTYDFTDASNLTTGTLPAARLDVYSGTANANVNFPITSYLLVDNAVSFNRNLTIDVRLNGGNTTGYTIGIGTAVTGTWRSRGLSGTIYLAQRVS